MRRIGTPNEDLVDAQWVADMLGLTHRNAVSTYQRRFVDMPRPEVDPGPGRPKLWHRGKVEQWAINTGRIHRKEKWHLDPHYRDILEGLDGDLDADLFEDCVADVLHPEIPVVPIEGGSDGGMDGAVFDGRGEPFPLITTTAESVIRNLGDSLKSYSKVGGKRSEVVLATSRHLTPLRRRNLHERASDIGFTLVQIIDRRGVADRLYRSPRWCKLLFGLTGEPLPFRPFPPSTRSQHHGELVGRTEETDFLLSGKGDQLLVGPPGSGKTAILNVFAKATGGLFLHPSDPAGITNGLRTQRPTVIVVDDAHTRMDELQLLARLRSDLELSYRIVSSVWRDEATETAIADILDLDPSDRANVLELTRDQIVEIVGKVGVEGPIDLVREIVNQARGLPGLAVTLARACLRGNIRDVASGDAIGREIRRVLDAQGLPNAIDILAALGIAGDVGMRLENAAEELGLSLSQVRGEMAQLATAGVLGQVGNAMWAVYPYALRHVLVRDVFFGNGPGLQADPFIERVTVARSPGSTGMDGDWQWLMQLLPEDHVENRPHKEVARVLIGVRRAGGRVPPHLIIEHLQRSASNEAWAELAWSGVDEARRTLREQPASLLDFPEPFLAWIPNEALTGLLDAASNEQKAPIHTSKNPPLQVITRWIRGTWQPKEALRRRKLATHAAIRWGNANPVSDLPCRVLGAVLSTGFEYATLDPGSGDKLTIHGGVLQKSALQEISSLWCDPVLPFLRTRPTGTLRPIVRAVSSWKKLTRAPSVSSPPEPLEAEQTMATRMLTSLLELTADHPGLWAAVARLAEKTGMEPGSPDWEYMLMYGPLDRMDAKDWEAAEAGRLKQVRNLGKSRADLDPVAQASRLAFLETAASETGHRWPRYTPQYAEALAQYSTTDPLVWVRAFVTASLPPDLVQPFLSRASEDGTPGLWETVQDLMAQPEYEWLAIFSIITSSGIPSDLTKEAISRVTPYTPSLGWIVLRDQIGDNVIRLLLQHNNDQVASTVAIEMWSREYKPPSDSEVSRLWRRAIMRTQEDLGNEEQLGLILASDQELAVKWLSNKLNTSPLPLAMESSATAVAIDSLDQQSRIDLLPHLQPKYRPSQITAKIVGKNLAVYQALLEDQNLKNLHLAPLEGQPEREDMGLDADWAIRAEIALENGYAPDQIADATFPRSFGWSGPESQMWESWILAFQTIPTNTADFRTIQTIGIKTAQGQKHEALTREHKQQIYGDT